MTVQHRLIRAGFISLLGLSVTAATGVLGAVAASAAPASAATTAPRFAALAHSVPATADHSSGPYRSPSMTIGVALRPRNAAGLASTLRAVYTKGSGSYHHWLAAGRFDARYAPPRRSATRWRSTCAVPGSR